MATNLDLQEQEQLDQLKAFWGQYGNLIVWALTLVLAAFASLNGWNYWQRDQGLKAGAMFDELDIAFQAGDEAKVGKVFSDLKERFPRTAYAQQGGLLAAAIQFSKDKPDAAMASLKWVADNATDEDYRALAHLRSAGLLMDKKDYGAALQQLDQVTAAEFSALADDRRGDILMAQGKRAEAVVSWKKAFAAMSERLDYRRVLEAKLIAVAAEPQASGVTP